MVKELAFITHNNEEIDDLYTSNKGTLLTDYNTIKKVLGEPNTDFEWGHQQDVEWRIKFSDGQVATVYNWKNGPNSVDGGWEVEQIEEWEVGGKTDEVFGRVKKLLGLT